MTKRTQVRASQLTAGMVTTLGTIESVQRRQADVYTVRFVGGGFRTCTLHGVFTVVEG